MTDTPAPIPRMTDVALQLENLVEDFYEALEKGSTQQEILRLKHNELTDLLLWISGHRTISKEEPEKLLASFLYDQYTAALGRQVVTLLAYERAPGAFGGKVG